MSVTELYESYASGKITRGAFIRRLVGFGMTLPVATAYAAALARSDTARADLLPPESPPASGLYDSAPAYGLYDDAPAYGLYDSAPAYGLYDLYPPGS